MPKILFNFLIVLFFICCGRSERGNPGIWGENELQHNYKLERSIVSKSISFTAYKTNDKIGVKGIFKHIKVYNGIHKKSQFASEALNEISFFIPFSSLSTNDKTRDKTILENFFYKLKGKGISGKFYGFNDKEGIGNVDLAINGKIKKINVSYRTENNSIYFNGIINIGFWDALSALTSLNEACIDLHKGLDGISKTWDVVNIEGEITFQ